MNSLLTTEEVAEFLRTGPSQVRELVRAGLLAAVNIATGKKRMAMRFAPEEVEAFVKRRTTVQVPLDTPRPKRREQIAAYAPMDFLDKLARGEVRSKRATS